MKKLLALAVLAAVLGYVLSREPDVVSADDALAPAIGGQVADASVAAATPDAPAPEPAPRLVAPEPEEAAPVPVVEPDPVPVRKTPEPDPRVAEAVAMAREGKPLEARVILSDLYRTGDLVTRRAAAVALKPICDEIVFDPRCTRGATIHTVQPGEYLTTIAKKYGVNWRGIERINKVDPRRIKAGGRLKVIEGAPEILIDKSEFRLALFVDGLFVKEYVVGHGKDNSTPTGEFEVAVMEVNPTWYPPEGGAIKFGEPGHLIGTRWIGFRDEPGAAGYGIHGTNEPKSVGKLSSNGCIRLTNDQVEELFCFVTLGAKVRIIE